MSSPIFPRSCNKPLQTAATVRGLGLDAHLLAVASVSHLGRPFHLDAVRKISSSVGDERSLQTPADFPLDETARVDYLAAGLSSAAAF